MFDAEFLIHGREGAANNYARGYYTNGKELMNEIERKLDTISDKVDHIDAFMITHSLGGGTGSGLSSLMIQVLNERFSKKSIIEVVISPCPRVSIIVLMIMLITFFLYF